MSTESGFLALYLLVGAGFGFVIFYLTAILDTLRDIAKRLFKT